MGSTYEGEALEALHQVYLVLHEGDCLHTHKAMIYIEANLVHIGSMGNGQAITFCFVLH